MKVKLSAVIITFNEERNIGRCLESLREVADEIVVVDNYSTDRTREISESYGAVYIRHVFRNHMQQKNWAIDQASFPCILSLDADECLSQALKESISKVKANWTHDAYYFNRRTNYCGKWVRHSGWLPGSRLRLWDSRKGSWGGTDPPGELIVEESATKEMLKGDLLHYSYQTMRDHVSQINVSSTIAAEAHFKQGKRSGAPHILARPLWHFLKDYLFSLGMLDGFYGLVKSAISAHAVFLSYVKLRILQKEYAAASKKTLCFFNTASAWGGGEKWHLEIASSLYRNKHAVVVVTNTRGELRDQVQASGIPSHGIRVSNFSFLNPLKIMRVAHILRREGVGLVVMNLSADMKLAGIAAKIAGVRRIIYRRGSAIPIRNTFLNRFLFRRILDEVLANSLETKKTLLENNSRLMDPSNIRVIYNGIKFENFEGLGQGPCYTRSEGEVILGNAGRLEKQKAQHFLVDLAVELKRRKKKFKILIAGSGRLESQLRDYARIQEVEDSIVFLGFMEDMKSFMETLDIFVLSSLWEGFGYVIVEAMANAKPVVAFDVSSNPEIIEDGKNGYLVPPFDIGCLADRVVQLIEDEGLRNQMGLYAKKSVYERFSYERALHAVEQYLIINESPFINK